MGIRYNVMLNFDGKQSVFAFFGGDDGKEKAGKYIEENRMRYANVRREMHRKYKVAKKSYLDIKEKHERFVNAVIQKEKV